MSDQRAGWAELVRRQGGVAARRLGEVALADLEASALLGVITADEPHVPAIVRCTPAQAVAMLVLGDEQAASGPDANALLAALEPLATPCFVLNDGPIGADAGESGAIRLSRKEANELLGAAMGGELAWELDPDFGYEVAVATPSLSGERAMALAPRLAYAANGHVYDHATLVPRVKEERHTVLASIPGLDPAIVAASGWPVEPTGSGWRSLREG